MTLRLLAALAVLLAPRCCEAACVNDYSQFGAADCDAAYPQLTCAELENDKLWNCSGCECPGDQPCTATDGAAVSSSYPCTCGSASCTAGQACELQSNSCINMGCVNDYTDNGVADCDAAFPGYTCQQLESNFNFDCSGCLCPGDQPMPDCDATDGSSLSSAYPCGCGSSNCTVGQACDLSANICINMGCVNNYSEYGLADCDAGHPQYTCHTLEEDYQYDCAGCLCPGDQPAPDCDETDGSVLSSSYPCQCGASRCSESQACDLASETCAYLQCAYDYTDQGSDFADCDAAWPDWTCQELEQNNWDCTGCACPGDQPVVVEDCDVVNGSGFSSSYPCACGSAECGPSQVCDISSATCTTAEMIKVEWPCPPVAVANNSETVQTTPDGVYVRTGTSASGAPVYRNINFPGLIDYYVYHDPSCDGEETRARWYIGTSEPNLTASSDLDGNGRCSYLASVRSEYLSGPPSNTASWKVVCENELAQRDMTVSLVLPRAEETCGIRGADASPFQARIVNGQTSSMCEWRWQACLSFGFGGCFCGGTLLSPTHVLTAAHCVVDENASSMKVSVGEFHHKGSLEGNEQVRGISQVSVHPDYGLDGEDSDIALLTLDFPVFYSDCVATACLPDADAPAGKSCFVTGWGRLEDQEDGATPDELQEGKVTIFSKEECGQKFGSTFTDNMFCANGRVGDNVVDSCQGDSGGPLVCEEDDGSFKVYGVVSWGSGCANENYPGVYAEVNRFRAWIDELMATSAPTSSPTPAPTATPPTAQPTEAPTSQPTRQPTQQPTAQPTEQPTAQPTTTPTAQPTAQPTITPTAQPTAQPTITPQPTAAPPTAAQTNAPTAQPTPKPTAARTTPPTAAPTAPSSTAPTSDPTPQPTEAAPTSAPTEALSVVSGSVSLRSSGTQSEVQTVVKTWLAEQLSLDESSITVEVTRKAATGGRVLSALSEWEVSYEVVVPVAEATTSIEAIVNLGSSGTDSLRAAFEDEGLQLDAGAVEMSQPSLSTAPLDSAATTTSQSAATTTSQSAGEMVSDAAASGVSLLVIISVGAAA